MELGSLRTLALDLNMSAHGVDATVTRPAPDDDPITTRAILMTTQTEDAPMGAEFTRRDPIRVLVLRRDEVPTVPLGTVIVAPERLGGEPESWVVDGYDLQQADQHRVIVRRATDEEA